LGGGNNNNNNNNNMGIDAGFLQLVQAFAVPLYMFLTNKHK
jgi:hypothetical protein